MYQSLFVFAATFAAVFFAFSARAADRRYRVERAARLALHQARIEDNNWRSFDNELWAQRVRQGKEAAFAAGLASAHGVGVYLPDAVAYAMAAARRSFGIGGPPCEGDLIRVFLTLFLDQILARKVTQ